MKYLIIFFTLILFSCNEPEVFSCPGGQTEDVCGACCNNSSIECSTGPNTGVMDACGTCFGEVENEAQCLVVCENENQDQCSSVLCEDEAAGNYGFPIDNLECPCNYNYRLSEVNCDYIVDFIDHNGICYMINDNPVLEIDLQFLLEDDFCHGDLVAIIIPIKSAVKILQILLALILMNYHVSGLPHLLLNAVDQYIL